MQFQETYVDPYRPPDNHLHSGISYFVNITDCAVLSDLMLGTILLLLMYNSHGLLWEQDRAYCSWMYYIPPVTAELLESHINQGQRLLRRFR